MLSGSCTTSWSLDDSFNKRPCTQRIVDPKKIVVASVIASVVDKSISLCFWSGHRSPFTQLVAS